LYSESDKTLDGFLAAEFSGKKLSKIFGIEFLTAGTGAV
jgi:hypothetical protein